ncbi:MAG TPA: PilZ domain-containing protein [Acidisarcina sp.]
MPEPIWSTAPNQADLKRERLHYLAMYTFNYRPPRFPTDFPVDFVVAKATLRGRCNNINSSGLQAEFNGTAVVGDLGMLTLDHSENALKLYARITYFAASQTGLSFVFRTEQERAQLLRFVEIASGRRPGQGILRAAQSR